MSNNTNEWHRLLNHEEHQLHFGDTIITVHDGVFTPDPTISQTASMILEHLPNVRGKRVADIGTGTGVLAVVAALNGAAEVVATDIDDKAIANAQENVAANKLEQIVTVTNASVLDGVAGPFDYIFANIPILDDVWDKVDTTSVAKQLMVAVHEKMTDDGQLFIPWGSFAEDERQGLEQLLDEHNLSFFLEMKQALGYTWYLYKIRKQR